jgi:acetoin utilization protein AcuA
MVSRRRRFRVKWLPGESSLPLADVQPRGGDTLTIETSRGPIWARALDPGETLEGIDLDLGMGAFVGYAPDALNQEKEALPVVASLLNGRVFLVGEGSRIVGYVAVAPPYEMEQWDGGTEGGVLEVEAIEVSRLWRRLGIAHRLLEMVIENEEVEKKILFATGYAWHWDLEGTRLSKEAYREVMIRLFAAHGFARYATDEPSINSDSANILLVRIGSLVTETHRVRFLGGIMKENGQSLSSP